jgi:hypothetical protein
MRGFSSVLWRPSLPKTGSIEEQVFDKLGRHDYLASPGGRSSRDAGSSLGRRHKDHGRAGIATRADGAIRGTVWPFANQRRFCRLPGHAAGEPADGFGPPAPGPFSPGCPLIAKSARFRVLDLAALTMFPNAPSRPV